MKTGSKTDMIFRAHREDLKIANPLIRRSKDSFLNVHRVLAREFYYGNNLFHSTKYSLNFYPEYQVKETYFINILKNKIVEE